jgi:uncharacterized protein with HEPN domain
MLHALTVIGEASSKLSEELKSRHANVPWRRVSAVRHRIVHDYSGLDYELIWQVVTVFTVELEQSVSAIYELEFPELSGEAQPNEWAIARRFGAYTTVWCP